MKNDEKKLAENILRKAVSTIPTIPATLPKFLRILTKIRQDKGYPEIPASAFLCILRKADLQVLRLEETLKRAKSVKPTQAEIEIIKDRTNDKTKETEPWPFKNISPWKKLSDKLVTYLKNIKFI